MDVFKIDLEPTQICSNLVDSSSSSGNNICAITGAAGVANGIDDDEDDDNDNNNENNHNKNNINDNDDDDGEDILPEVSFDANSDFNLHFFDTPEDSSTQGGYSEPGSVESDAYIETTPTTTPTPPNAQKLQVAQQQQQQQILETTRTGAAVAVAATAAVSVAATLPILGTANAIKDPLQLLCDTYYNNTTATATATTNIPTSLNALHHNTTGSTLASSAIATLALTTTNCGNGGGALYAISSVHQFGQSHSSCSSSGCSSTSTSSTTPNGNNNHNNNNSNGNGINFGRGSATVSSTTLGIEHFVGNNCNGNNNSTSSSSSTASSTASSVSSTSNAVAAAAATTKSTTTTTAAIASSLAHLKTKQGMYVHRLALAIKFFAQQLNLSKMFSKLHRFSLRKFNPQAKKFAKYFG